MVYFNKTLLELCRPNLISNQIVIQTHGDMKSVEEINMHFIIVNQHLCILDKYIVQEGSVGIVDFWIQPEQS